MDISARPASLGWGSGVIRQLDTDLTASLHGVRSLSYRKGAHRTHVGSQRRHKTHNVHTYSQENVHTYSQESGLENPFRPSAGATPPEILGRAGLLDECDYGLRLGAGAPGLLTIFTGARASARPSCSARPTGPRPRPTSGAGSRAGRTW